MIKKIFLKKEYSPIILLIVLWLLVIVFVNPLGNFPLNDDWAYSFNVYNLTEKGIIDFSDWPAMTLISHVLWGAIFCKIFGFSFTILRISNLILSIIGIISIYLISKKISKNTLFSIFVSLIIAFNPIFFSLSYTFMTDTSFLTFTMLGLLFFIKFFEKDKTIDLLLATIFTIISVLIRQIGLFLPIAFAFSFVLYKKFTLKSFIISIAIILITYSSIKLYENWLLRYQDLPQYYSSIEDLMPENLKSLFLKTVKTIGIIGFYIGLFLSPLVLYFTHKTFKSNSSKINLISLIASAPFILTFISAWKHVPIVNIFYNLGLGPKLLKDAHWNYNISPQLSVFSFDAIKVFAFISAFFAVFLVINEVYKLFINKEKSFEKNSKTLILVLFLLNISFLFLNRNYFDRYNLIFFPLLSFFFIPFEKTKSILSIKLISSILLILFISFSIFATKDYLSWNRARWVALDYLQKEKNISPNEIDGGFEFNGWNKTGERSRSIKYKKSWWFVDNDEYVVSFGNICNYHKIKGFAYNQILSRKSDSIYILKRNFISEKLINCDLEETIENKKYFVSENKNKLGGGITQSSLHSKSGNHSAKVNNNQPFCLSYTINNVEICDKYKVSVWRYAENNDARIVIYLKGSVDKYLFSEEQVVKKDSNNWELLNNDIIIPENCVDCYLEVYIWNPGTKNAWFDDFSIIKIPH